MIPVLVQQNTTYLHDSQKDIKSFIPITNNLETDFHSTHESKTVASKIKIEKKKKTENQKEKTTLNPNLAQLFTKYSHPS